MTAGTAPYSPEEKKAGGHAGGPAENAGPLPESLAPKDLYVKAPYRAVVGAWAP